MEPAEARRHPWPAVAAGAHLEALYDSALQHSMATAAQREGSPSDLPEREGGPTAPQPPPQVPPETLPASGAAFSWLCEGMCVRKFRLLMCGGRTVLLR